MPRKQKSQNGNPYDVIRGMWEGAYVSHFIRLFQKKFGFCCVTTQELEEALVEKENIVVSDVIARLLRYATGDANILIENFDTFLRNFLIKESAKVPHFLESNTTWQDLTPEEKLGVLKWLVDHISQQNEDDISDFLDENFSADDLRGICAGQDAFKNVYWYLDDLRLYREFPHKKQNKKDWECVCLNLSDWQSFIKQFRKTTNLQEKELYTYLNFELFPVIELGYLNLKKVHDKKEFMNNLMKREKEDICTMLDKESAQECNSDLRLARTVNGSDTLCIENNKVPISTQNIAKSSETGISKTVTKTDDSEKQCASSSHESSKDCATSIKCESATTMNLDTEKSACVSSCLSTEISNNPLTCGNKTNYKNNSCIGAVLPAAAAHHGAQEATHAQPSSDIPSDSSSVASNKENAPPSSSNSVSEIPPMSAISNMVGCTTTLVTTASVQPLPSNVVTKTSFQVESQYMQQQSQIFVFSTALANKAAESYLSGHFPSIIAFHCAQPGTKSFLEKYPLKVQQFNRQNSSTWMHQIRGVRPFKRCMNHFPGSHGCPSSGPCNLQGPNICTGAHGPQNWPGNCATTNPAATMTPDMCNQQWPVQHFSGGPSSSSFGHRFPGAHHPEMNIRQMAQGNSPMMGCMVNPNIGGSPMQAQQMHLNQAIEAHSTLAGVKVPDENLTPQQKQHRMEQLSMIRKMQQILFPEQRRTDQNNLEMGSNMEPIMAQASQTRFGSNDMCIHPGMDPYHSPCGPDHMHSHPASDMYGDPSMPNPDFNQSCFPPDSMAAQLEWQRLQRQFYEERRKKSCSAMPQTPSSVVSQAEKTPSHGHMQQSSSQPHTPQHSQSVNSPSPSLGLSPDTRLQGPPPPYHQANRRPVSNSHPASPNNSTLSLPSPHTTSGLSSPADMSRQFSHPTSAKLSHPSPGPTTPAGGNSSVHSTPLSSPKSSGLGCGALIKTPTTPSNSTSAPTDMPANSSGTVINSAPSTPVGPSTSNRKQIQQCNSELQDSNSVGSVNTTPEAPSSCATSTTNSSQGEVSSSALSCSQSSQKQDNCSVNPMGQKEPNLMPVPSPQQIQYLNTFDGQELTIQKQPNTSIRDLDIMSPASLPTSVVMSSGANPRFQSPEGTSFPNTPGSCPSVLENSQDSIVGRYPVSAPASVDSTVQRFPTPSPQMPSFESSHRLVTPLQNDHVNVRFPNAQSIETLRLPCPNSVMEGANRFPNMGPHGPPFDSSPTSNLNHINSFSANAHETMHRYRSPGMDSSNMRFIGPHPQMPSTDLSQSAQHNRETENISSPSFLNSQIVSNRGSPCIGSNFPPDRNLPHSHLQNLQKMTPPFESITGNKSSPAVMSPVGPYSTNMGPGTFDVASSSPQGTSSQRLSHFNPIASMAAMSESTASIATAVGNPQVSQNVMSANISTPNMAMTDNFGNSNPSSMNNFPSGTSPIQRNSSCSLPNPIGQFSEANNMSHNIGVGPPNINNAYNNSPMSMQQLNQHNVISTSLNSNVQGLCINSHSEMHTACQNTGANTISCSVTTNHPIMHTAVTTRTSNMGMPVSRHGLPNFPGQPPIQRASPTGSPNMMMRGPTINSPNIQVRADAPNTIQYLPARQQNPTAASPRAPSLEFLQRFAPPLTNLDNKVPTHNLQYFPNSGVNNPSMIHGGMDMNSNSGNMPNNLMNNPRPPMNMMMGRMIRGVNPHSNNQMFPMGPGLSEEQNVYSRPPCPPVNNQMMSMNSVTGPMFVNKQLPMPIGGLAPDATQPLPPSMGQSFTYKQSPFYGPTTADPNYAVQFHNFQQQLYATNTRGSQMGTQNTGSGQGFFSNK